MVGKSTRRGVRGLRQSALLAAAFTALTALAVPQGAAAAPGDINTWAGGSIGNGYSLRGSIRGSADVAYNAAGDKLYIADRADNRVRVVSEPFSQLSTAVGNGLATGPLGDGGAATAASLAGPDGVTVDAAGNLFIADTGHNRIRKVTTLGVISTVAGSGIAGFAGDGGPALAARLNGPRGVAVDTNGDLYIADSGNGRIRRVSGGVIETIAGNGIIDDIHTPGDIGPAETAAIQNPVEVALAPRSPTGAFTGYYIADARMPLLGLPAGTVWFVDGDGFISRFAGCLGAVPCGTNDGSPALFADLVEPTDVSVDAVGNVYIADTGDHRIRFVNLAGTISTVAGQGVGASAAGDGGPAKKAFIDSPEGAAPHPNRVSFAIADTGNFKIRKVTFGDIGPIVGALGDGGQATNAWVERPRAVATDSTGLLYLIDGYGMFRKVQGTSPLAYIKTLLGDGPTGGYADAFNMDPRDVNVDPLDRVYIADLNGDRVVRYLGISGVEIVTTAIATPRHVGGGRNGYLTVAESTNVNNSKPVVFVANGGNSISAASTGKAPVTFAGAAACGYSGDGGPASAARLCGPRGMDADAAGNLYIADTGNNAIRKVTLGLDGVLNGADDIISTVVVTPAAPLDVSVGSGGTLYITLAGHTVVKYTGVLTTIAGTGVAGFSGDGGPGSGAQLDTALSAAFDSFTGRVYIADTNNDRVRFLAP